MVSFSIYIIYSCATFKKIVVERAFIFIFKMIIEMSIGVQITALWSISM